MKGEVKTGRIAVGIKADDGTCATFDDEVYEFQDWLGTRFCAFGAMDAGKDSSAREEFGYNVFPISGQLREPSG